jgi:hypothetical protein
VRIAHSQIVVVDATAARQQVEGELQRLHVPIAARVLEVALALARRFLKAIDARLALELVFRQSTTDIGLRLQRVHQRDRVLHRKLGAGSDREVRGVRRVTDQYNIVVVPGSVLERRKAEPLGVV